MDDRADRKAIRDEPSPHPRRGRHYTCEQHHKTVVGPGFSALYRDKQLCDATLIAEGQSFKVHRCYMAACSAYFHSMFTSGFSERQEGEITIAGVTALGLQAAIRYMYTGEVDLDQDNLSDILEAASHLQILGLQERCECYLFHEISDDNSLHFLLLSDTYSLETASYDTMQYIVFHFDELCERPEYLTIPVELLCQILASDELAVDDEFRVLGFVVRWLRHDPERKDHAAKVLRLVRFGLMTLKQMMVVGKELLKSDLVGDNKECVCILDSAMTYRFLAHRQPLSETHMGRPRNCIESLVVLSGICGKITYRCYSSSVYARSFELGTLSEFHRIGQLDACVSSIYDPEIVFFKGYVFVVGGLVKTSNALIATTTAFRYEPSKGKWLQLPSMNNPRYDFAFVASTDSLVALGGSDNSVRLSSVEEYSIEQNTWTGMLDMLSATVDHAGCVHNACIYTSGGCNEDDGLTNAVHCFDLEKKEWAKKCPLNYARCNHIMIPHRDRLLVCTGDAITNTDDDMDVMQTEVYDIKTDQWTVLATRIPLGVYGAAAACRDNHLYVIGGHSRNMICEDTDDSMANSVQCYNMDKDEWVILDYHLPVPIVEAAAGFVMLPWKFLEQDDFDDSDFSDSSDSSEGT